MKIWQRYLRLESSVKLILLFYIPIDIKVLN
jgi:hypothetical protein